MERADDVNRGYGCGECGDVTLHRSFPDLGNEALSPAFGSTIVEVLRMLPFRNAEKLIFGAEDQGSCCYKSRSATSRASVLTIPAEHVRIQSTGEED